MLNINGWELLIISVLFVLLVGPDRLPEVAAQAGRFLRDLRGMTDAATAELRRELELASRELREPLLPPGTAPLSGPPDSGGGASGAPAPATEAGPAPQEPTGPELAGAAPSIFRSGKDAAHGSGDEASGTHARSGDAGPDDRDHRRGASQTGDAPSDERPDGGRPDGRP